MVFTTAPNVPAQVPGIAPSMMAAQGFVQRIVMQAVFDVLERQGRNAGLSDAIIAIILGQLNVQVNYTPLKCNTVFVNPGPMMENMIVEMMRENCIIVGNRVTAICTGMGRCVTGTNMNIGAIPATALSISGTLTTTNIIMANWSRDMWQSVVNRVVRTLASGPFGESFFSASATVT